MLYHYVDDDPGNEAGQGWTSHDSAISCKLGSRAHAMNGTPIYPCARWSSQAIRCYMLTSIIDIIYIISPTIDIELRIV